MSVAGVFLGVLIGYFGLKFIDTGIPKIHKWWTERQKVKNPKTLEEFYEFFLIPKLLEHRISLYSGTDGTIQTIDGMSPVNVILHEERGYRSVPHNDLNEYEGLRVYGFDVKKSWVFWYQMALIKPKSHYREELIRALGPLYAGQIGKETDDS